MTTAVGRVLLLIKSRGVSGVADAIGRRVFGTRMSSFAAARPLIAGKAGLEIGGPSSVFAPYSLFPAYAIAGSLDNCTFSHATVWAKAIAEDETFVYRPGRAPGRQFFLEGTSLETMADARYDFVLSSHTIEHCANPLLAITEWIRVIKVAGAIVLVAPHKEGTFDHRRPVTTFEHLVEDYRNGTGEDDLTHLPEILACHDLSMDPLAGGAAAFRVRSERNLESRCLHHHVFDTRLVVQMLDWAALQILEVEPVKPYHIVAVAQKRAASPSPQNDAFTSNTAAHRRTSPFRLDRA